jgi:hypothetical protein
LHLFFDFFAFFGKSSAVVVWLVSL